MVSKVPKNPFQLHHNFPNSITSTINQDMPHETQQTNKNSDKFNFRPPTKAPFQFEYFLKAIPPFLLSLSIFHPLSLSTFCHETVHCLQSREGHRARGYITISSWLMFASECFSPGIFPYFFRWPYLFSLLPILKPAERATSTRTFIVQFSIGVVAIPYEALEDIPYRCCDSYENRKEFHISDL